MNIIKFSSNNSFLANHFQQTYNQKNKFVNLQNSKKIIFVINKLNQTIEIKNHEIKFTYKCPFSFNQIFSDIQSYLYQFNFKFGDALFFPFSNILKKNKKIINLNFIHNTILTLILFNEDGVSKDELYKIIWPNDFELSMNKLDTHFTNLKELVKINFKINLNIRSYQGKVKLIIN